MIVYMRVSILRACLNTAKTLTIFNNNNNYFLEINLHIEKKKTLKGSKLK